MERSIGYHLQDAREKRGLTQEQAANELNFYLRERGLKGQYKKTEFKRIDIKQFENGEKEIKIGVLVALSSIYGIDCHEMLTGQRPEHTLVISELGLSERAITILKEPGTDNDGIKKALNYFFDNGISSVLTDFYMIIAENDYRCAAFERIRDEICMLPGHKSLPDQFYEDISNAYELIFIKRIIDKARTAITRNKR